MQEKIKFELTRINQHTTWPCSVCGIQESQSPIAAEVRKGKHVGQRICENCLKEADFDFTLKLHSDFLIYQAEVLEGLIGRIDAPAHCEWLAATKQICDEQRAALILDWAK